MRIRNFYLLREEHKEGTEGGSGQGGAGQGDNQDPAVDYSKAKELFSGGKKKTEEVTQEDPKKEESTVYEGAGGKFKTVEELVNYTKKLEESHIASKINQGKTEEEPKVGDQFNTKIETSKFTSEDADKLFQDPEGYLTRFEEKIVNKIEQRDQRKVQVDEFWGKFYSDNPELKNSRKVVDLVMKDKWDEFKALPIAQAKEKLAEEARTLIKSIRGDTGRTENLEDKPSHSLSSTSASTASRQEAQEEKVVSFADQLKTQRRKRRV